MPQVMRSIEIHASPSAVWLWLATQEALRRWISSNIEIDLRVDLIKPETANLLSRSHCVVGTIQYPDQVGLGYLVYLKASLVGDEPEDVLQYHVAHPDLSDENALEISFLRILAGVAVNVPRSVLGTDSCRV